MSEFPKDGPVGRGIRLARHIRNLHITTYSGYASYFIILSLFPTLVLILGLLRYTPLEPDHLTDLLEGFLPATLRGHARSLIYGVYENTSRTAVSLSALAALWSAGKGIYGLMKGLNAVYEVQEHRGWLRRRLLCAVYMVSFLLVLMLTLVLHVFGNTLAVFLRHRGGSLAWLGEELPGLRYFLLVAVQTLLFALMFMYLPGRNNRFLDSLPGGALRKPGLDDGFRALRGICGAFFRIQPSVRPGLHPGAGHAVAVCLCQYVVFRWDHQQMAPENKVKMWTFRKFLECLRCVHSWFLR